MSSQPQVSSSQPTAAPSPAPTTKRARGKTADGGAATGAKRPRKGKAKVGTPAPETPTTTAAQSPVTNTGQLQWAEATATASQIASALSTDQGQSGQDQADGQIQGLVLPAGASAGPREGSVKAPGQEEDDEEALPEMAEDDYSAQLSWQSQSKDNLKVLMDNFTPEQYDRFEAYRRHALPKQAVRKVVQQGLGHQVSTPVAQIVAGFSKVFVGEIIEKAREVQQRRGDTGPLSPDHLREAYHIYQVETGRVGAARPLKSKQLFRR